MHPILISLGPFKLRVYGLALALSFLLGSWLALKRGRARGMSEDKLIGLFWWIVISSVLGARFLFVQAHPHDFRSPLEWFAIWTGGLTLYGGLIAAVLVSWIYVRRQHLSFLGVADVIAPSLALGEGITRIGCFFNGCCFGQACSNGLAVHFPPDSYASYALGPGIGVWPSQLLLSASLFLSFGILLLCERRIRGAGALFGGYLLLQGIARYLVDFTRYYEPSDRYTRYGPWLQTHSQLIALVLVLGGIALLIHGALGRAEAAADAAGDRAGELRRHPQANARRGPA